MKQTRAQHAASMRNLRKAHAAVRHHTRRSNPKRRHNPRRHHARRRNPEMPVVLVNPRHRRHHRRNPTVGHYVTANPRRHHRHSRYRTLHNPSRSFGGSAAAAGLGLLGGVVAGGLDWGVSYAPITPIWQSAILGAASLLLATGVSYLVDARVGAGIAGGAGGLLVIRTRAMVALHNMNQPAAPAGAGALRPPPRGAAALAHRPGAGAVLPAHAAGAIPGLPAAHSMAGQFAGPTTRVPVGAGAGYQVPDSAVYGPQSWIRLRGSRAVSYVSAHGVR